MKDLKHAFIFLFMLLLNIGLALCIYIVYKAETPLEIRDRGFIIIYTLFTLVLDVWVYGD